MSPHQSAALFSLVPVKGNVQAERPLDHPDNASRVATLSEGVRGLNVNCLGRGESSTTLAILGRGETVDIFVDGPSIARVQCSLEMNFKTGVVMLYDRSSTQSTQVSGVDATPFECGRERKMVVHKYLNTIIGMGGKWCDRIQFELQWHYEPYQTAANLMSFGALSFYPSEHPRLARTEASTPTEVQFPLAGQRPLKIRYSVIGPELGSGQFGTVYKAINKDSGHFIAVKSIRRHTSESQQEGRNGNMRGALHREAETLSRITHLHIVQYLHSQGWDQPEPELFIALKDGTLGSLIKSGANGFEVAEVVFPQMLQALNCIACAGIIHRDVKPENILYVKQPNGYQFQLGDFWSL